MTARRQELTGWALVGPDGVPLLRHVGDLQTNRSAVIDSATKCWSFPTDDLRNQRWRARRRAGYSLRRVRVTVEVVDG